MGQRHGLIVKGRRRSCPPQYGHRDPHWVPRRLRQRQRHGFEHGFPLIRSLRVSAQPSTSVLFSFVLSLIVAASFTIRQSKTSYGVKRAKIVDGIADFVEVHIEPRAISLDHSSFIGSRYDLGGLAVRCCSLMNLANSSPSNQREYERHRA